MPVASAPTPLSAARHLHPGARLLIQCTTIPACDSVKQTNTPTAYSGTSAFVSPLNNHTSRAATDARAMMPLEKASRSPRAASCLGMYPSWARMPASLGKSANAVFAASTRMAKVEYWRAK